jgi:hypothetical protein
MPLNKCSKDCQLDGNMYKRAEKLLKEAAELRSISHLLSLNQHREFAIQVATELELHAEGLRQPSLFWCANCPHRKKTLC